MLDWRVEGESSPSDPNPPKLPRPSPRWGRILLVALLLILVTGAALLAGQARARETELRAELTQLIAEEARAQAFGQWEQGAWLVDPAASSTWRGRYAALYERPRSLPVLPFVQEITWGDQRVTVQVTWPTSITHPLTETRAYRLVEGTWRRTPRDDIVRTRTLREHSSAHFRLRGEEEVAALLDDRDLRLSLEALRARVVTYWPDTWGDYFLTLHAEPQELSPPVYFSDAQKLYINRPSIALLDPASPLPAKAQYRLAVTTAVVQWLTTPDWMRDPETRSILTLPQPGQPPTGDWIALYRILQQAEARHWALDGAQRRDLRNAWRTELAGTWPDPFQPFLDIDPDAADPEVRQRWLALTLVIERQIALNGPEVIGRMARTLVAYPPDEFSVPSFFQALVGGSSSDLEQLFREYVLTPE